MAYYHLAKKAVKYTLLAPFIKEVLYCDKLEKCPVFFRSNYSPVINNVTTQEILAENDRFSECQRILDKLNPSEKTLIFFPTVSRMYKYITEVISKLPLLEELPNEIYFFTQWAKDEIHEDWCLITALERGYIIHNGQIPVGTRMFQLDRYEKNEQYNKMLCTSTLLEGVNTTAKNIIITKPSRMSYRAGEAPFEAFDFFNLVGRTGRLFQHYIGDAYYIKSPNDPVFEKAKAIKSIQFEISDESKDIDIQKGKLDKHQDVLDFFNKLGITHSDYLKFIGTRMRFENVKQIYARYATNKNSLFQVLETFCMNKKQGRYSLVKEIYNIIEPRENKLRINLITSLLSKRRPRIKDVVDNAKKYFKQDINYLISEAIKMKAGYIEHSYYKKASVVRFFMEKEGVNTELLSVFDDKILHTIEFLYFASVKHKKMLIDLGIYERDVDKIIKIIGDDFFDAVELRILLQKNIDKIQNNKIISYISKYIIRGII